MDVWGVPSIRRDLLDAYLGHFEPVARSFPDGSGVRVSVTVVAAQEAQAGADAMRALERLVGGPVSLVAVHCAVEA
jgi:hypothetical protein